MFPYEFYKIVHIVGLAILTYAFGAFAVGASDHAKSRKVSASVHGTGLLLMLIGGFGMWARLGMGHEFPAWLIGKILIWLVFGALMVPFKRKPALRGKLSVVVFALVAVALYLVIYKPGA